MPDNQLAPPDMPWLYSRSIGGQQNSLAPPQITPPDDSGTDQGAALGQTWQAVSDYLAKQRAQSAEMGLWDDQSGMPTAKGLLDAAQQTAQGVMMGTTAPGEVAPGFTAYHGSPHSFDRFDTSKIGTGEGAQAYGHGLYFAENEGVARSYRDALTAEKGQGHYWQDAGGNRVDIGSLQNLAERGDPQGFAASMLNQRGSVDEAIADVTKYGPSAFVGGKPEMDATLAGLQDMKARGVERVKDTGSMYEVNIAADPAHFLDWDKPLSEQHPVVREQLADVLRYQKVPPKSNVGAETTGGGMMQYLEDRLGKVDAANELASSGIPGIRYLDQGSRGAGAGTSNHVIFDANTIDILRKYGIAGLMAGGAAAGSQQPQQ